MYKECTTHGFNTKIPTNLHACMNNYLSIKLQVNTNVIEYAGGKQTVIDGLVKTLPHLKSHTSLPPPDILLLVNDCTLRGEKTQRLLVLIQTHWMHRNTAAQMAISIFQYYVCRNDQQFNATQF